LFYQPCESQQSIDRIWRPKFGWPHLESWPERSPSSSLHGLMIVGNPLRLRNPRSKFPWQLSNSHVFACFSLLLARCPTLRAAFEGGAPTIPRRSIRLDNEPSPSLHPIADSLPRDEVRPMVLAQPW